MVAYSHVQQDGRASPPHADAILRSPNLSMMSQDFSPSETGGAGTPHDGNDDGTSRLIRRSEMDDDIDGYYYNAHNPGFGGSTGSSTLGRAKSSRYQWTASQTSLSDELNPRGMGTSETLMPNALRHRSDGSKDLEKPFIINAYPVWDTIEGGRVEDDDYLHDPNNEKGTKISSLSSTRGLLNIGMLVLLAAGIMALFAGYPIVAYYTGVRDGTKGAFGLGGTNATGQVAVLPSMMRTDLIDTETPTEARTKIGSDGKQFKLVFSDEFNTDGRSFYPGDDPFWEAVDLHYWGTNNLEWYDPASITTKDGAMHITLSQTPEHNLNFRGGMIQSWNKFCFTGGLIEVSVRMPGDPTVPGLWPAVWTMGNLGRAGYGATLEGTWPYSYDQCDVGTLQNQTDVNGNPQSSATGGDTVFNRKHRTKALSFLGGQRLSACTCPADYPELHPGPKLSDGNLKGRAAPEIDIFEAQVDTGKGKLCVSQSCQWAPYNNMYETSNTTGPAYEMLARSAKFNVYTGEITQQSASSVTDASQVAVQHGGDGSFAAYGFEYKPGTEGYIEWLSNNAPSWRLETPFIDPDPVSMIGQRTFPSEPMYVIMNLGISENFATPNWDQLADLWPFVMSIDYVRVYQPEDAYNVGCDPEDFPTADFIQRHMAAYTNANLTLWGGTLEEGGYQANWPRNRLNPNGCKAEPFSYPGSPTNPKPKAPAFADKEIAAGQA